MWNQVVDCRGRLLGPKSLVEQDTTGEVIRALKEMLPAKSFQALMMCNFRLVVERLKRRFPISDAFEKISYGGDRLFWLLQGGWGCFLEGVIFAVKKFRPCGDGFTEIQAVVVVGSTNGC